MRSPDMGRFTPFLIRQRLRAAESFMSGRVLDFGCGRGSLADVVPAERYLGVEINRGMIEDARQLHAGHQFIHADDLDPESRFDTVAALAVIEHLPDPRGWAVWARERLTRDGHVVVTTPHARFDALYHVAARMRLVSHVADEEHEETFDKRSLFALFTGAGLHVERYQRFLLGMNQLAVASPR
jgi:2-polyprenyl-3-methyl-5-hydroxy-6-metoxy-1,4-benzoquinol methylase